MTRCLSDPFGRRVRLLPVLIVGAVALLGVRLTELVAGIDILPTSPALAAEDKAAADTKPADAAPADGAHGAAAEPAPAPKEGARNTDFPVEFTPGEVAVLQDLARRRDTLLGLEKELAERERLLSAAEGRLDRRIAELEQLRTSIEALVRQYTEQEQKELQSIVTIYETMKPKDAARILEELEMRVLLGIMEAMKERKSAPILAAMQAERAREVTTELARKREIDLLTQAAKDKPPS